MSSITLFIISIGIPLVVGGISGALTAKEITGWYKAANKPSINPPNYVFGPVWTTLYLLMGIALFLVLKANNSTFNTCAVVLFATQLILNFIWSIIFFRLHKPGWALAENILLWLSIAATIAVFYQIKPAAAWLLVPYLCWVTFAIILNAAFWKANP